MKYNVLELAKNITPLDENAVIAAKNRQNELLKPPGALGVLEELSIQLAGITGKVKNDVSKKIHFVFGADNGVFDEGVTASPKHFTHMLMDSYGKGFGCGINILCRKNNVDLVLVDMGIEGSFDADTAVINRKIMPNGTKNLAIEPAMSEIEAKMAMSVGFEYAAYAKENGYNIVGGGEVGMANTTTAAAVIMALVGTRDAEMAVGRGGGLTDEAFALKKNVILKALEKYDLSPDEPLRILHTVGGLDIAALCGLYLGCAYHKLPVVIDGVIAIAAALMAYKINPLVREYMIPSHISEEPAYKLAAEKLGIKPMLRLEMRLGEGSGCPVAMGIVEQAAAIMNDMMTFSEMQMESEYRKKLKN